MELNGARYLKVVVLNMDKKQVSTILKRTLKRNSDMGKKHTVSIDVFEMLIKPAIISELIVITRPKITTEIARSSIEKEITLFFSQDKRTLSALIRLYESSEYLDYQKLLDAVISEIRKSNSELFVNSLT
jgi:hypothetical protein